MGSWGIFLEMNEIKRDPRIEKIRRGVLVASGDIDKKTIALECGFQPSTLSTLIKDHRIGLGFQDTVEAWLRSHGYWEDMPDAVNNAEVDPGLVCTAKELDAVSAYLLDPRAEDRDKFIRLLKLGRGILEGYGIEVDTDKVLAKFRS